MGDNDAPVDLISSGPTIAQQFAILDTLGAGVTDDQRKSLESRARLKLIAGGERAGKSYITGLDATTRILWGRLFWIIGLDYELAKPEFFYISEWLQKLGAIENPKRDISTPKYGKCSLRTKTGQIVETKTADDARKIAAQAPDGIILAEAAQLPYDIYLKAIGRLSEKRGWLIASGTFEGSAGWYPEIFDEWKGLNIDGGVSFSLPTWGNNFIFPGGRNDPEVLRMERAYSKVPGLFDERCGAVPVPPVGLVFRQFRETVHLDTSSKYQPNRPVYLFVDPSAGTLPYAVGAAQFYTAEEVGFVYKEPPVDAIDFVHVIDRIYARDQGDEEVIAEAMHRVWWADVRGGAIDVEAPDSKRRWLKYGHVNLAAAKVPQIEGIRRLQSFLYYKKDESGSGYDWPPHLLIHPDVEELPYEFRHYKRPTPVGGRTDIDKEPKDEPPSNQPNHLIKALWYLLIARYGYVKSSSRKRVAKTWSNRLRVLPSPTSQATRQ